MNRFDEQYDIRLARADETAEIMDFLDKHWKKGHILSVNKELYNSCLQFFYTVPYPVKQK